MKTSTHTFSNSVGVAGGGWVASPDFELVPWVGLFGGGRAWWWAKAGGEGGGEAWERRTGKGFGGKKRRSWFWGTEWAKAWGFFIFILLLL
jgi:hypothetical protein